MRLGASAAGAAICTTSAEPSPGDSCTTHKPVARETEPHRLGVDRDRAHARVARQVRQIAAMKADGHTMPAAFVVQITR